MDSNLTLNKLASSYDLNMIKNEVLFILNIEGIITDIEAASSYILGFAPEDMIGKPFSSFLIEEYKDFNFYDFMLPKDKVILTFKRENSYTHVEINYQHLSDSDNNITGVLGSILDISSYIKYKKRLDSINQILDNSKDLIYYYQVSPEVKFTYLSKSLETILGYSVESHYNDPTYAFRITHPDDLEELYKKANGTADYSKSMITRWMHADGHYIWMEDYPIPVYDYRGNLIGIQGVCRDITQRVLLEQKLEQLTKQAALAGLDTDKHKS